MQAGLVLNLTRSACFRYSVDLGARKYLGDLESAVNNTTAWIGLFFVVSQVALSATLAQAQEDKVVSNIEIPVTKVNQTCIIGMKNSDSTSTETLSGKIERFDDAKVVLVGATRSVRIERRVPILGTIPYLARYFRNVGIATENVPGELSVDRSQIESIKFPK